MSPRSPRTKGEIPCRDFMLMTWSSAKLLMSFERIKELAFPSNNCKTAPKKILAEAI